MSRNVKIAFNFLYISLKSKQTIISVIEKCTAPKLSLKLRYNSLEHKVYILNDSQCILETFDQKRKHSKHRVNPYHVKLLDMALLCGCSVFTALTWSTTTKICSLLFKKYITLQHKIVKVEVKF